MSNLQTSAGQRVLVVSQDARLHENLRVDLGVQSGDGAQSRPDSGGKVAFTEARPAGGFEQAGDAQSAVGLARAALAAGNPYQVALLAVVDSSRQSSLETAASLWRVDPELQVVLCAGEASCAWAETVGTRDRPDHTAVLRQPIDPLHARQLMRLLGMQRDRLSRSHPNREVAAGGRVAGVECQGEPKSAEPLVPPAGGAISPDPVESSVAPTVLLVEDDEAVRQVTRLFLEESGCRILEAGDSVEALRLWQSHRENIDLLMTDLVIPGQVDGLQLANQFRAERPDLKVVLTSGFMDRDLAAELDGARGVEFLFKPYSGAQIEGVVARLRGGQPELSIAPGPGEGVAP